MSLRLPRAGVCICMLVSVVALRLVGSVDSSSRVGLSVMKSSRDRIIKLAFV